MKNAINNKNIDKDWYLNPMQLVFLIIIGLVIVAVPNFGSILWMGLVLYIFSIIFAGKIYKIWNCIVLIPGMEIISRMAKPNVMPFEIGKYILYFIIVLFYFSIFDRRNVFCKPKYKVGYYLLIAMVPSLIVALYTSNFDYQNWIFNISGIVQLGILLIFAAKERWSSQEYYKLIKLSVLPIIPILTYLTIKTPKFEDIEFSLGANTSTSGGFGSNQVSTILGTGLLVVSLLAFIKQPLFKQSYLNLSLIIYILFRGLLTFSRGGILIAVLGLLIAMIVYSSKDKKIFRKLILILFATVIVGGAVFYSVNKLTNNMLYLRYSGETEGTLGKGKVKNLNSITSNRSDIAVTDFYIFRDNLVFGVGPGESRNHRKEYGGYNVIPHTEYTRLLSEHGLGGVIIVLILSFFPIYWIKKIPSTKGKAIATAFFILSIGTTFHAAMRTSTSVVYFLLACFPVIFSVTKKVIPDRQVA